MAHVQRPPFPTTVARKGTLLKGRADHEVELVTNLKTTEALDRLKAGRADEMIEERECPKGALPRRSFHLPIEVASSPACPGMSS